MSIIDRTNRKRLINPHTGSNSNKPTGILNLGEIAIEHSGVDSAKLYIETDSASTSPNTIATFITENETKGYVDGRISGVTEIISDLVDIVLTGGTGDDIINVTINGTSADTSANTFTITHKSGSTQSGFTKLETDSYGHVTAGTDVTIEDITSLSGFDESVEEVFDSLLIKTDEEFSGVTTSGKTVDALFIKSLIVDDERTISAAFNDLNTRIVEIENMDIIDGGRY